MAVIRIMVKEVEAVGVAFIKINAEGLEEVILQELVLLISSEKDFKTKSIGLPVPAFIISDWIWIIAIVIVRRLMVEIVYPSQKVEGAGTRSELTSRRLWCLEWIHPFYPIIHAIPYLYSSCSEIKHVLPDSKNKPPHSYKISHYPTRHQI